MGILPLLACAAVAVASAQDVVADRLVAVVSGQPMMASDLRAARALDLVPGAATLGDAALIDRLIVRELMRAEVERFSTTLADVDRGVTGRADAEARTERAGGEAGLAALGLTPGRLLAWLEDDARIERYMRQRFDAVVAALRRRSAHLVPDPRARLPARRPAATLRRGPRRGPRPPRGGAAAVARRRLGRRAAAPRRHRPGARPVPAMTAAAGTGAARVLRAAGTALPVGLGLAAAAGAIALLVHPDGWTVLTVPAGLALAAVAWLRPVAAVALLLALSPICGHRPTTGPFVAFVALTACAVPGWLARLWTRDRGAALDVLGTPVGLALTGYVGASVLSLSSLPLYAPTDIVGAATAGEAIRLLPGALAAADVTAWIYPVLTVLLTLHAAVAALTVAVAVRAEAGRPAAAGSADAALQVTGGILAGLVLTIAAGALDRLGYLDLRVLRATDPFTNLTGADRLQSTFGHAGWFAEYLCFATPAILALWLWPAERRGARAPRSSALPPRPVSWSSRSSPSCSATSAAAGSPGRSSPPASSRPSSGSWPPGRDRPASRSRCAASWRSAPRP